MLSRCPLSLLFCLGLSLLTALPAQSEQAKIRARLGAEIETAGRSRVSTRRSQLRTSDALRFYITPLQTSYLYLIYANPQEVSLLNQPDVNTRVPAGTTVIYPAQDQSYQADGSSPQESYTIICSPAKQPKLLKLLTSRSLSYKTWKQYERGLIKDNRFRPDEDPKPPTDMAGRVREIDPHALPIFTGKSLVIRKYEFRVSK